jgi:hypothetical protein
VKVQTQQALQALHAEQADVLAAAELLAVRTLIELSGGCEHNKILTGNTKRGPAFVYLCERCADVTVISIPAGGLRNRELGDPTSRTRIATLAVDAIVLETGAFIESDGTIRARFAIGLPGRSDPEWEIIVERPAEVGVALRAMRGLRHDPIAEG